MEAIRSFDWFVAQLLPVPSDLGDAKRRQWKQKLPRAIRDLPNVGAAEGCGATEGPRHAFGRRVLGAITAEQACCRPGVTTLQASQCCDSPSQTPNLAHGLPVSTSWALSQGQHSFQITHSCPLPSAHLPLLPTPMHQPPGPAVAQLRFLTAITQSSLDN